jgi:RHH-type proline utilization regulon transcriptional repressor/proline dehydrogenase/delta 1-pyrroline-5-carboxylate dehydrogenase
LILQKDIYEKTLGLLTDAMAELVIGDPSKLCTDIPPVIDVKAKQKLDDYKAQLTSKGKLAFEMDIDPNVAGMGNYVSPAVFEIENLLELGEEQFGPILHVMSFESGGLVDLISEVNGLGYGLTLGVHSRINETIDYITTNANVGNLYVNRNMVGAVVGVQPFGGEGLSGTGPKAGGPNYLQRFCTEKTISVNTAAVGGNASLLTLNDD